MAERFLTPSSRVPQRFAVSAFDAFWAAIAPLAAFVLRDVPFFNADGLRSDVTVYCALAFLVTLLVIHGFRLGDGLSRYFSLSDAVLSGKVAMVAVAATALMMFTWTRMETLPRSILVLHCIVLAAGLVAGRALTRLHHTERERAVRRANPRHTLERQNAILIGADRIGFLFLKIIEGNPGAGLNVVALLDPRSALQGRTMSGYRIAGTPDIVGSVIDEYGVHGVDVHRVIIATHRNLLPEGSLETVRAVCAKRGIRCELLTETMGLVAAAGQENAAVEPQVVAPEAVAPQPAVGAFASVFALPSGGVTPSGRYWGLKRCIDVAAALTLGVLLLPVALVVALLVYYDVGGPVMFWQQRVGRHGARFAVWKFRTFHAPYDRWGNPRLDRASPSHIGRLLRHSRLDELPQLYNVIVGEMSMIGPRPLLPIDLPENDDSRLAVRPGLTGWAQVNGGKLISAEDKNLLDLWYIENASLKLDALVVAKTLLMMVRGDRSDSQAIEEAWALAARRRPVGGAVATDSGLDLCGKLGAKA